MKTRYLYILGAVTGNYLPWGQGAALPLFPARSKVDSFSPNVRLASLPRVMGDICLIYHKDTSALQVFLSAQVEVRLK